jgi:hypothetical protein
MAHDALRYTEVFVMLQMQTLEKMPSAETRDLLGYASSPLSRRERVRVRGLKAQRMMSKEVL